MSDVFTLSVRLEGAAFTDGREAELSRVLRELATVVKSFRLPHYGTDAARDPGRPAAGALRGPRRYLLKLIQPGWTAKPPEYVTGPYQ